MNHLAPILVCAAVTYGLRLAGFAPALTDRSASARRFLAYVPVAVFAALLAPDVVVGGEVAPRLLGALATLVVVWRLPRLWAGLAAGMAVYWLARGAF